MQRKDCDMRKVSNQIKTGLLFAIAACVCPSARAETVELWRDATITDEHVSLRDICTLSQFEHVAVDQFYALAVAKAPEIGESAVISMADVRRILIENGLNPALTMFKGATQCEVKRVARTLPDEMGQSAPNHEFAEASMPGGRTLRQVIEADLGNDAQQLGGWVQVVYGKSIGSMLDMREGPYEFEIRRTNDRQLGLISLEIIVLANGEEVQRAGVVADVTFVKPTVVAARPINLNAAISKRDVSIVNKNYKRFEQAGLASVDAVIGQRAKRFIRVGEIVQERHLEPVPLVKRGQIVQVHSRSGGVMIESVGRVMKPGAYGDVIELQTADRTRRKFTAMVTGPGLVSVGPMSANGLGSATHLALGGEQ
jgi:flagella basal body P-ring formation protein FlgA